jgi:hypothetical protein
MRKDIKNLETLKKSLQARVDTYKDWIILKKI